MNSIAKSLTNYQFENCDTIYNMAMDNNMAFRGHTTCWANTGKTYYQPSFIRDETDPVIIESFLKSHIQTVIGRYAGHSHAWDVMNEAIDVSNLPATFNDSVWAKVDDFICKSFKWA